MSCARSRDGGSGRTADGVEELDEVFRALADPSRRRLLDSLNARNGQSLRELCSGLDMARQSVSKHLAVLEAANLVTTARRGREKLHYLNAAPINAVAERWIHPYDRARARALADLTTALEHPPMNDTPTPATVPSPTAFVYVTYIRTTPERLWQALTDPAFTRRYWGVTFESGWTPGSTMTWEQGGETISDPEQVILEAEPYRRLAYTWHTFTPGWARAAGVDEETLAAIAAEPRSKVAFEIEPQGGDVGESGGGVDGEKVKLTVIHDGFAPDSTVLGMVSQGWPELLSDLKTLLETTTEHDQDQRVA
ncbi:ArsR/SmtB family transcription factor [Streptomyces sp. 4N509B]|uniref:ArsR/SmtB family transcription factor n=1 Tax=Streptomyces sp. 4N509B TaxID=3457413 RepID=UPI003FD16DE7